LRITASPPSSARAAWAEARRANDLKLGRDVAIKILLEAFSADPDRMARFTREAQVLVKR
jgi:hypothetical protein